MRLGGGCRGRNGDKVESFDSSHSWFTGVCACVGVFLRELLHTPMFVEALAEHIFTRARHARQVGGSVATLLAPLLLVPLPALAKKGDYANLELDGRGGSSVSSLGKNDIPGAGKIDPYDNRCYCCGYCCYCYSCYYSCCY